MEHLTAAWNDVMSNLVGWLVLALVYAVVVVLTCGLGLLLVPNLMRATRNAIERGSGPDLMDLFDLSDVVSLLLLALLSIGVSIVGQVLPIVGPLLAGIFLLWTTPLVVDGHYDVLTAAQVSVRAVSQRFAAPAIFTLVTTLMVFVSSWFCLVPLLVTVPVALVATWRYYQAETAELLAVGDAAGLRRATA